ncbi:MAG: MbcA/ParS/Xre antitoxin family protein [Actinomycetota bacterium]|jgi:hypothetical protein|nr:MbcA/ParS/Xre antitoxin family protein [Actinomycetota bacterium]
MMERLSFEISAPGPTARNHASRKRQERAARRTVAALQHLLDETDPDKLGALAERVERALKPVEASEEKRELAARISGGRTYSPSERATLEAAALARSFARRREVLAETLSAPEVADLLGTSRQTPHDRTKAGTLLGILDRGALRFPAWQFDPGGEDSVVSGLPEVLGALKLSPFGKASWLSRPNPYLGGRTPAEVLKDGETAAVRRLALSVGVV